LITPTVPQLPDTNTNITLLSEADLFTPDVLQIPAASEFLVRQFLKKEVATNEDQSIVTDVSLTDLKDGHTIYGHNESTVHFAASVNKLPVTMLALEELRAGHITLDTQLNWAVSDQRAGNGVYDQPGAPLTGTVREVLHDLLNRSGNTAVRIMTNKTLGGATAVNARLALVPQIPNTRLIPLDGDRFYLGNTTSKEALWTLNKVLEGNDQYQQYVRQLLATNIFVGDGVRSQLAGNDFITLVNKTGLLFDPDGDNFHDVGIIYNTKTHKSYGYAMLTTAPDASPTAWMRADQSLKDMGKDILRFSGDKPMHQNAAPQTLAAPASSAEHGKILY
jgi:beta-lactamase class A